MENQSTTKYKKNNLFMIIAVFVVALIVAGLTSTNPILSLVFILILLATTIAVRSPEVLAISAFFIIFTNASVIAYKFHGLPFILGATIPTLLLGIFIFYQVVILKRSLVFDTPLLLLIVYFAVSIFGAVSSINPLAGFDKLSILATEGIFLYLLILNSVRSPRQLRQIIWAILFGAIFIGGLSAFQQATGTFENNYWGFAQVTGRGFGTGEKTLSGEVIQARLEGPLGEKNYYAQLMLMVVPIGLFQFRSEINKSWKFIALVASGLAMVASALTFSRGVAVAFVILILVMILFSYISLNQIILMGIGLLFVFTFFPQYTIRLLTIQELFTIRADGPDLASTDVATQGRVGEMYTAWLVFIDHPLLGVGPNMFREFYQDYADFNGIKVHNEARRAHNIFLEVAANNGLIGLIFFVSIPGFTLYKLNKVIKIWRKKDPAFANMAIGIFLAITTYLANGLFLSLSYERYYWFILAIGGAIVLISEEKNIKMIPAVAT